MVKPQTPNHSAAPTVPPREESSSAVGAGAVADARPLKAPCGCSSVLTHEVTCDVYHPDRAYSVPRIIIHRAHEEDPAEVFMKIGVFYAALSETDLRRLIGESRAALDEME